MIPMQNQKTIVVNIFGTEYSIKGETDPDYIRKVARYVDSRMREIAGQMSTRSATKIAILVALNITDELFREQAERQDLQSRIDGSSKRLVDTLNRTYADG